MSDWFTDEELDRIAQFAASPKYSRKPTMLLPDDEDEESESEADRRDE